MSESSEGIKSHIKMLKEVAELKELLSSLVERVVKFQGNKENTKPSDNKPNITGSNYKNRRSAYISKLNNKDIKQPKEETMKYYNVVYDADKNLYFEQLKKKHLRNKDFIY